MFDSLDVYNKDALYNKLSKQVALILKKYGISTLFNQSITKSLIDFKYRNIVQNETS